MVQVKLPTVTTVAEACRTRRAGPPSILRLFFPESGIKRGRIGFVGRLNDPRKNINLLLDVAALLKFKETN